jgi:hypothetical protein
MGDVATALGGLMALVWLFLIVAAILWIFVPFVIFGIGRRQRVIVDEIRHTNVLLGKLATYERPGWQDTQPPTLPVMRAER